MSVTIRTNLERDALRSQLAKMDREFRVALPDHIKSDKFQRVVMTAVQQTPDLLLADRRSLLMAATKCATDGLIPDGREAAFVIFNAKVKVPFQKADGTDGVRDEWKKLVQYMPMRAGIQKRAMNSGLVLSLQGHIIYEYDHFLWHQGTAEKLEHVPKFPGDRGKPIGAYAIARVKGQAEPIFRVMDKARIDKAREVSRNKDGATWTTWWDEMAIKTVIRNLSKDLPAAAEIQTVVDRDDEDPSVGESTETIDSVLVDETNQGRSPSKLDVLEGTAETVEEDASDKFPGDL